MAELTKQQLEGKKIDANILFSREFGKLLWSKKGHDNTGETTADYCKKCRLNSFHQTKGTCLEDNLLMLCGLFIEDWAEDYHYRITQRIIEYLKLSPNFKIEYLNKLLVDIVS